MKREFITLSMKDQNKVHVLSRWSEGLLETRQAFESLDCSRRSLFRWKAAYLKQGAAGLIHGNRGRASPNCISAKIIRQILKLRLEIYGNINDTHFCEKLNTDEGIAIGRSTLQRVLRSHSVAPKRKRRPKRYHSRREPKEALGMMLQLDASYHEWLGPLKPKMALHGAIDDATGIMWAVFEDMETTHGYLELMRSVFDDKGMPLCLYTDRHSIFYPTMEKLNPEEQRRGLQPESQFGRAMRELGIQMKKAYTPQAKGKIERVWQTFQDRLVIEMKMAGIQDKASAQMFLKGYLKQHNAKFAKKPKSKESLFRKPPGKTILDDIFCRKEFRVVQNDHTVSYQSRILQIPRPKTFKNLAKKTVEIWDRPDGIIKIAYQNQIVACFKPQPEEVLLMSAA
jgi:transposase